VPNLERVEALEQTCKFCDGMLVAGALSGGDAGLQALVGFGGAAELEQGLRRHLESRHVIRIVRYERREFGEARFMPALRDVLHGETVARKSIRGIELKDFAERGNLVHAGNCTRAAGTGMHTDLE
jgi:hypothetical protein